jgi:Flp pilus assembly pilin Flp
MLYLRKFLADDSGQDMVEYGLLAAFISIVAIGTLIAIKPLVIGIYEKIRVGLSQSG